MFYPGKGGGGGGGGRYIVIHRISLTANNNFNFACILDGKIACERDKSLGLGRAYYKEQGCILTRLVEKWLRLDPLTLQNLSESPVEMITPTSLPFHTVDNGHIDTSHFVLY